MRTPPWGTSPITTDLDVTMRACRQSAAVLVQPQQVSVSFFKSSASKNFYVQASRHSDCRRTLYLPAGLGLRLHLVQPERLHMWRQLDSTRGVRTA